MTTDRLREHVLIVAASLKGHVWPNGLGFDARGWEYLYHDDGTWSALRRTNRANGKVRFGRSSSPTEAKRKAMEGEGRDG